MNAVLSRPMFVVGCPRSGTTLVQCILSASSQTYSLPETHFFSYVLPELGGAADAVLSDADLARARQLLEREADLPDLGDFWSSLQHPSALELFVAIVEHFRPAPGLRAIEKTPLHVMHMEWIGALFPDALFVNVVRDPIDVASSLLSVPWAGSRSVLSNAQRWTASVLAAEAYAAREPARITTVVYERLVQNAEAEVRRLCDFVGLTFEASMLEEFGKQAQRNVGRAETWKRDVGKGVLLNRSGVWRARMSPGQAWLVAQVTRRLRGQYGYAAMPRASASSVAQAALAETRVRFAEARPRTGVFGAARHAGTVFKAVAGA